MHPIQLVCTVLQGQPEAFELAALQLGVKVTDELDSCVGFRLLDLSWTISCLVTLVNPTFPILALILNVFLFIIIDTNNDHLKHALPQNLFVRVNSSGYLHAFRACSEQNSEATTPETLQK